MAKQLYDYWFVQFDFPNEEGKPYKSSGGEMVWNEKLKRDIPASWKTKAIEDIADVYNGATLQLLMSKIMEEILFGLLRKIYLTRSKNSSIWENARFHKQDIILAVLIYCLQIQY